MTSNTRLPLEQTEQEHLQKLASKSDLIFVGVVLNLDKPPQNWSGFFTEYQTVTYQVDKILKGKHDAPEIKVDHVVVAGSMTAAEDTPALSPKLFSQKAKLIISARKADNALWKALDEDYSALPATQEWIQKIESALRKK